MTRGDVRFRGDVDGLRAVAILLVVAYHAGIPGVSGGFVGVDVFFVISGWLITRNLLRETSQSGRLAPTWFWAKRVRRLVPAMAVMIVAVFALTIVSLPVFDWRSVADDGSAAALYVSNIVFARGSGDYFGGDIVSSPFLHTWSLGVEEQFYLLWPLLFLAAWAVARAFRGRSRPVVLAGFAITAIVSFLLCVRLTRQGDPWAFFGLPSRAWEFAIAGLLAGFPSRLPSAPRLRLLVAAVGLAMIGFAGVALSTRTPYPGSAALLPVIGTLLVIAAGEPAEGRSNGLTRALATRPTQWLGRVSYSWYLWHWPLIVLAVAALDDNRLVTTGAALVALAVAAVVYRRIENPVRFAPVLTRSRAKTFALGAVITLTVLASAVGLRRYTDARFHNTLEGELQAVRDGFPDRECTEETSADGVDYCVVGDRDSSKTVLLVGDSHARMWKSAMGVAAEDEHIRVVTRFRGGCPLTVTVEAPRQPGGARVDPACTEYREDTRALIDSLPLDGIVVAETPWFAPRTLEPDGSRPTDTVSTWVDGLEDLLRSAEQREVPVGIVLDNPGLPEDPLECIAREHDRYGCNQIEPASNRVVSAIREAEADLAAGEPGVPTFDISESICPGGTCQVYQDGIYVYADKTHLTEEYTHRFRAELRTFLRSVIGDNSSGDR